MDPIRNSDLYDETKQPGIRLMLRIIEALVGEGLLRASHFNGGEVRGLVRNTEIGSRGYCVHDRRATDGTWEISVVLSGERCGVRYEEREERGGEGAEQMALHKPVDPQIVIPRITGVFTAMGLSVRSVRVSGYQEHWDGDIDYSITVTAPDV